MFIKIFFSLTKFVVLVVSFFFMETAELHHSNCAPTPSKYVKLVKLNRLGQHHPIMLMFFSHTLAWIITYTVFSEVWPMSSFMARWRAESDCFLFPHYFLTNEAGEGPGDDSKSWTFIISGFYWNFEKVQKYIRSKNSQYNTFVKHLGNKAESLHLGLIFSDLKSTVVVCRGQI